MRKETYLTEDELKLMRKLKAVSPDISELKKLYNNIEFVIKINKKELIKLNKSINYLFKEIEKKLGGIELDEEKIKEIVLSSREKKQERVSDVLNYIKSALKSYYISTRGNKEYLERQLKRLKEELLPRAIEKGNKKMIENINKRIKELEKELELIEKGFTENVEIPIEVESSIKEIRPLVEDLVGKLMKMNIINQKLVMFETVEDKIRDLLNKYLEGAISEEEFHEIIEEITVPTRV